MRTNFLDMTSNFSHSKQSISYKSFIFLAFLIIIASCSSPQHNDIKEMLAPFMGTEVKISEQQLFPVNFYSNTSLSYSKNTEYKIVVYFSENECSECTIKSLFNWQNYMNSLKSNKEVSFYLIFKNADALKFMSDMSSFSISLPYFIDTNGVFEMENPALPKLPSFHTFLLKNNRVRIVGSPINNAKILRLYKKELSIR